MKVKFTDNYAERRRKAYPEIGDQLDALWKGGEELEKMRQSVMEVKQRFPKPQQ